jgi:hypothetical protein
VCMGTAKCTLRSVRNVRFSFTDIFIDLHNVIKLLACNFQINYCILISTYLGVKYNISVSLNSSKETILLLPWRVYVYIVVVSSTYMLRFVECIYVGWIPIQSLNYLLEKRLS